jgi:dTDP-4-dehydrorhamnose reductase
VVDDQVGGPTWCRSIAELTAAILDSIHEGGGSAIQARLSDLRGTYHYSAAGEASWFGFAKAILETDPARSDNLSRDVLPIGSDQYPSPAKRPLYSVLSNRNIQHAFGVGVQPWQEQLDACWRTLADERQ